MEAIQPQKLQVKKDIPFKLGRFSLRKSSKGGTLHLFIFNSDCYVEMVSLLHKRVDAGAQLALSIARSSGFEPDYRILGVDTNDLGAGVRPHQEYEVYHIEDCTVEHFNDRFCYLTIINKSTDKREKAIRVLKEVFK